MIMIPDTMKRVQIVYLTILTAAGATAASGATEVLTADSPEGTVACFPPCTAQPPSSCPTGTSPYQRMPSVCWACLPQIYKKELTLSHPKTLVCTFSSCHSLLSQTAHKRQPCRLPDFNTISRLKCDNLY
ncbi:hypothetical protein EV424DRAFT_6278 [Suillus variegatus]|nr:hypothetical protein EV424DRAFT_6278 [Suillus variegatus]